MKIKPTEKGNIKLTVTEEQLRALRDFLGGTSKTQVIQIVGEKKELVLFEMWSQVDDFLEAL